MRSETILLSRIFFFLQITKFRSLFIRQKQIVLVIFSPEILFFCLFGLWYLIGSGHRPREQELPGVHLHAEVLPVPLLPHRVWRQGDEVHHYAAQRGDINNFVEELFNQYIGSEDHPLDLVVHIFFLNSSIPIQGQGPDTTPPPDLNGL